MKANKISPLSIILGLIALSVTALAQNFGTITLDQTGALPQTPQYSGSAGGTAFGPDIAGLQYFNVTAQSGSFNYPSQLQLFCVELAQVIYIGGTNYQFDVLSPDQAAKGVNSGLSANIPLTGIGQDRANNLELLYAHVFSSGYNPTALSDPERLGFQVAVWKLSHDNLSLGNTTLTSGSGNQFWITTPADAAINQAQTWVDWVYANPTAAKMTLVAFHSDSIQDFLAPDPASLANIPEPSAYALLAGLAAISAAAWRRRILTAGG